MKKLLKLAEEIKSKTLRKQVVDFLKDVSLSNKKFKKYKGEKLSKAGSMFVVPASGVGPIERDIVNHTANLTELCIQSADLFKKNYGLELNKDQLVAASIVHDLMKSFEFKRDKKGDLEPTGIMLDHTMLAVSELYFRNFPEEVIHIVASHFGESGPTPPRSFEAVIFHHLDSLVSIVEYYHLSRKKLEDRILFLSDEEIQKLTKENEKE